MEAELVAVSIAWPSEDRAAAYWQAEDWAAELAMDDCPHEGSVCDCDEETVS